MWFTPGPVYFQTVYNLKGNVMSIKNSNRLAINNNKVMASVA